MYTPKKVYASPRFAAQARGRNVPKANAPMTNPPLLPIKPKAPRFANTPSPQKKGGLLAALAGIAHMFDFGLPQAGPATGPERTPKAKAAPVRKRSSRSRRSRVNVQRPVHKRNPARYGLKPEDLFSTVFVDPFEPQLKALQDEYDTLEGIFAARAEVHRAAKAGAERVAREQAENARAVAEVKRALREAEEKQEAMRAAAAEEKAAREAEERDRERLAQIQESHRLRIQELVRQREEQERRRRAEAERQKQEEERRRKVEEAARARQEQLRQEQEALRRQQRIWAEQRANRERVYRENYERRKAEEARRAEEEAARAQQGVAEAFKMYERRWDALKTGKDGDDDISMLTSDVLPWPMLDLSRLTSPDAFTKEDVAEFVFHPLRESSKSRKERVRGEMLRWHPDKFNAKVLAYVVEWEREAVQQAAGAVTRILTQLLKEEVIRERET